MPFDPKPFAEGLRAANRKEEKRIQTRLEKAIEEARRISELVVKEDPGIQRVYLFGSVATGEPTSLDFDIDIAIEGGDIYRALDAVKDTDFRVDLVQLHLLPEHVKKSVIEHGRVLYER